MDNKVNFLMKVWNILSNADEEIYEDRNEFIKYYLKPYMD